MQRLEVSGAVRPLYGSIGVKGLMTYINSVYSNNLFTHNFSKNGTIVQIIRTSFEKALRCN